MAKNTIKLKKYMDVIIEKEAAAAITPGMLLELTSADKVQAHSSAGQNVVPPMFALEDELQGNGIDDAYASGDPVQVWVAQRGEEVYAILADGENVSIGDPLESNGAGYLQKHVADAESWDSAAPAGAITVYPSQIVGVALEALDLSGSSGEESGGALGYNKRIKIMVV